MLYEVPQDKLIKKVADELKGKISKPDWAGFVKTGVYKQRPPVDPDWWYVRAASVLRKVDQLGPVGVSKLRTKYGGVKNRGVKPEQFRKGSGSVARKILQELEKAGLIKQDVKGKHKGRVLTPQGSSLLYSAAKSIAGEKPKPTPKAKPVKKELQEKKEEKAEAPAEEKKEAPKKEAKKAPAKDKKEEKPAEKEAKTKKDKAQEEAK